MALDVTRMAVELESMIEDLPAVVTFGDLTFNAALTMATVGADITEGGFMPSRDVGLHVRYNDVTKTVRVGSKLTINSQNVVTTYRVISIERSQDGQELILSCQSHRR